MENNEPLSVPRWRSLPKQAKRIGAGEPLLRRAVATGDLEASRPGLRNLLLSDQDVDAWLRSKRVAPEPTSNTVVRPRCWRADPGTAPRSTR
jgi:excisionase family DNA binding protein